MQSSQFSPLNPSLVSICSSGRGGNLAVDIVVRDGHDVLVVADVDGGGGVGRVGGAAVGRSLRIAFQGAGQPASRGAAFNWFAQL